MSPSREPQYSFLQVPGIFESSDSRHKIRALANFGQSKALKALEDWEHEHKKDHQKIFDILHTLARADRIVRPQWVSRGSRESGCEEIFEIKSGKLRIFGFYYSCHDGKFFVLTHGCLKPPPKEQNEEFKKSNNIRSKFLSV